ncbi:M56 family metallopeptidase [Kriegella aquimaris]|uniref:Signal transducer regulating beta-lactamase production, contains metallopeptidase domain n=1 Tax=Kriegella aquimaris TaxID=192904 RepID=A0A1G9U041_9FLAO|nr:M56 family metallopeptidase [Kriegella aquimaris]SDM53420.1 Signal transducer regulating beta-lactamase production, contains metallopeptidase domain [Kriegella aquimaris]
MIQYIIEAIAFQMVFLVIYDLFLKRETFFQWNRLYLIGTYALSLVLPWVKIEALKTTVPEQYYVYPKFLWPTDGVADQVIIETAKHQTIDWSWQEGIFYGGMLLAGFYFMFKIYRIYRLRKNGSVRYFPNFTRVVVAKSELAFSFFRYIFLGDKVVRREHDNIIKHELVHIRQKHSWDLIFFELMRICCWFNPLVYIYQSRISELHEFIADAAVAKTDKRESYQLLLSEVFQTEHISFINHFFKSSLIKKRIVMLQKEQSKKILQLKYLLMIPLLAGMLLYTSCQKETENLTGSFMIVDDIENLTPAEETEIYATVKVLSDSEKHWDFMVRDENNSITYTKAENGSYITFPNNKRISATMVIQEKSLSGKISELMEEIVKKDSLTDAERDALAMMIYKTFPNGVEGISGKDGALFKGERRFYDEKLGSPAISDFKSKYNALVTIMATRSRLLQSTNEENPIIKSLDYEIAALRQQMESSLKTMNLN